MWLTKGTGGIGLSVTKLRAQGSPIRSNNTTSTGPIPFMHTIDSILRAVCRGGKKFGALCFYMENWHLDFPEFLDLRQNSGDPYRRTRTANTAVWISDEFMKRVQNDDDWYLFDPLEVADLNELYGKAFSERYAFYVAEAEAGRMRMFKKIGAREQFKAILMCAPDHEPPVADLEGHDQQPCAQQQHGHDPPLQPLHRDHAAAGPRQRLGLQPGVDQPVAPPRSSGKMDWARIEESARSAVRQLDNLIDITISSVDEADFSNEQNRAIGLGVMGFTDVVERLGFSYESEEAYDLIDEIMEHVSYAAIDESRRPRPGARRVPELRGLALVAGPGAVRLDRAHRGRPRRADQGRPHDPPRLGRAAREGQGRHAQRDAHGDRADGLHRPRRRHHARPRPAVLADLQPLHLLRQVPRGQPQPGRRRCRSAASGSDVREAILRSQGDIQGIAAIPDDIKETYKTSFQLSPYAFLEVAARAQKWIDQAISRNMYLETRDLGDMMDIYFAAWERGVKTTYYLHMKPRHTAEQSTVRGQQGRGRSTGARSGFARSARPRGRRAAPSRGARGPARRGFGFGGLRADTAGGESK